MQTSHLWYQLSLLRSKILTVLLLLSCYVSIAQKTPGKDQNLPYYDEKRIHYGFLLAGNYSIYRPVVSDQFYQMNDTLKSVNGVPTGGFNLGFIFNARLGEYFDLRITPGVAFYSRSVNYNFVTGSDIQVNEATFIELPVLIKYKAQRRGNNRMYMIAGVKPGFSVANKNKDQRADKLRANTTDCSIELGFGLDNYFKMFKFAPELRFSFGLMNMVNPDNNVYSQSLKRLTTNSVTLYLNFE